MKKWESPCSLCKGKLPYKCMMCGWQKKKKIKKAEPDPKINARTEFLEQLAQEIWKFNMVSTNSDQVDLSIEKHIKWAKENIIIPFGNGASITKIAERTKISTTLVKRLLQNKMIRDYNY